MPSAAISFKDIHNLVEGTNIGVSILHRVEALIENAKCHHKLHVVFQINVGPINVVPMRNLMWLGLSRLSLVIAENKASCRSDQCCAHSLAMDSSTRDTCEHIGGMWITPNHHLTFTACTDSSGTVMSPLEP